MLQKCKLKTIEIFWCIKDKFINKKLIERSIFIEANKNLGYTIIGSKKAGLI
jgi:hypothetical protein